MYDYSLSDERWSQFFVCMLQGVAKLADVVVLSTNSAWFGEDNYGGTKSIGLIIALHTSIRATPINLTRVHTTTARQTSLSRSVRLLVAILCDVTGRARKARRWRVTFGLEW